VSVVAYLIMSYPSLPFGKQTFGYLQGFMTIRGSTTKRSADDTCKVFSSVANCSSHLRERMKNYRLLSSPT